MKVRSIWHTLELDCITNGISYNEYLVAHNETNCPAAPLTAWGYKALDEVFNIEVEQANYGASDIEVTIIPLDEFNGR